MNNSLATSRPYTCTIDSVEFTTQLKPLIPRSSIDQERLSTYGGNSDYKHLRKHKLISISPTGRREILLYENRTYSRMSTYRILDQTDCQFEPLLFHVEEFDYHYELESKDDRKERELSEEIPSIRIDNKEQRPKITYEYLIQSVNRDPYTDGEVCYRFICKVKTNISRLIRKDLLNQGLYDESQDGIRLANKSNNFLHPNALCSSLSPDDVTSKNINLLNEIASSSRTKLLQLLTRLNLNVGYTLAPVDFRSGRSTKQFNIFTPSVISEYALNANHFSQHINNLEINWNFAVQDSHESFDRTLPFVTRASHSCRVIDYYRGAKTAHSYINEPYKSRVSDEIKVYTKTSNLVRVELMTSKHRIQQIAKHGKNRVVNDKVKAETDIFDKFSLELKPEGELGDFVEYVHDCYQQRYLDKFFRGYLPILEAAPVDQTCCMDSCDKVKRKDLIKFLHAIKGEKSLPTYNTALQIMRSTGQLEGRNNPSYEKIYCKLRKYGALHPKGSDYPYHVPDDMIDIIESLYALKLLPL